MRSVDYNPSRNMDEKACRSATHGNTYKGAVTGMAATLNRGADVVVVDGDGGRCTDRRANRQP